MKKAAIYNTYSGLIKAHIVNLDEDYVTIELTFEDKTVIKKLITRDSFVNLDYYIDYNYGNLTN